MSAGELCSRIHEQSRTSGQAENVMMRTLMSEAVGSAYLSLRALSATGGRRAKPVCRQKVVHQSHSEHQHRRQHVAEEVQEEAPHVVVLWQ